MTRDWGVAMTLPLSERLALRHLENQGFICYLPRLVEYVVVRGKRVAREQVMFSRYLFVQIAGRWRSILGTRGVKSLVMIGEQPALIDEKIIEDIRKQEREDGLIKLPPRPSKFFPGQHVRVESGLFAGETGIYEGMTSQQREVVLLSMLGRKVRATIAAEDLSAR